MAWHFLLRPVIFQIIIIIQFLMRKLKKVKWSLKLEVACLGLEPFFSSHSRYNVLSCVSQLQSSGYFKANTYCKCVYCSSPLEGRRELEIFWQFTKCNAGWRLPMNEQGKIKSHCVPTSAPLLFVNYRFK